MKVHRGFTLIELLTVISIIGILASILFPVFARARESARRSTCSSNLRQISLAIMQYTQDYDERFPSAHVSDYPSATVPYGWADAIQPYLKNTQLYQCPSDPDPANTKDLNSNGTLADENYYVDYFFNFNLSQQSEAALNYPSLTVLSGDGQCPSGTGTTYYDAGGESGRNVNNGNDSNYGPCSNTTFVPSTQKTGPYHTDGYNFSFTDGHVKWFKHYRSKQVPAVGNGCSPHDGSHASFSLR
jgi:prepilin-type N-terminal cleavage/methylation domain-containing protein/prepilin-type processing-associated H-X9-DG protein